MFLQPVVYLVFEVPPVGVVPVTHVLTEARFGCVQNCGIGIFICWVATPLLRAQQASESQPMQIVPPFLLSSLRRNCFGWYTDLRQVDRYIKLFSETDAGRDSFYGLVKRNTFPSL